MPDYGDLLAHYGVKFLHFEKGQYGHHGCEQTVLTRHCCGTVIVIFVVVAFQYSVHDGLGIC